MYIHTCRENPHTHKNINNIYLKTTDDTFHHMKIRNSVEESGLIYYCDKTNSKNEG